MQQLAPGIWWLPETVACSSYLVQAGDRVVLIDPGMRWALNRVARTLHAAGIPPRSVTDILLTHYDHDHTGAAAEWQRRTGAQAWISAADAAILTGATPPPATWFRQLVPRVVGLPELPRNLNLVDETTEILPGVTAIPSPGHTPGHLAFTYERAAFIGDAAFVDERAALTPLPGFLMADVRQGDHTRFRLSSLEVDWFCPGHFAPHRRR